MRRRIHRRQKFATIAWAVVWMVAVVTFVGLYFYLSR